jgi:hypothetical protein
MSDPGTTNLYRIERTPERTRKLVMTRIAYLTRAMTKKEIEVQRRVRAGMARLAAVEHESNANAG